MDATNYWAKFFSNWSSTMPKRGVLITSFGEQILFNDFLLGEDLLLIQRQTPDTVGARQVVLPYESIAGVKIVEIASQGAWNDFGFTGELAPR